MAAAAGDQPGVLRAGGGARHRHAHHHLPPGVRGAHQPRGLRVRRHHPGQLPPILAPHWSNSTEYSPVIGCPARDPAAGGGVRGGAVRRRDRGQLGGARAVRGRGARGPAVPRHQVGVRAGADVTLYTHTMTRTSGLAQFGLEFLLAFMLVLTYLRVTDTQPGDQAQVGTDIQEYLHCIHTVSRGRGRTRPSSPPP